ncbi:hypothetical protein [Brevundimonas goettingensis]|uniref:Uncharacterized protein n=1 Tax=Brevundimonas goettingensis TaxID=2774190 RepID=A0A975C4Q1_9CAUL|nr:hypothetical protein [Brevundimonas goettingensis]QTC92837.1 hypothetical protein IFJ75_08330 [Brevundimonas goettingensis]
METIVVEPLARGWAVQADTVDNPMVFRTGRAAEETARALAFRLAQAGKLVRLRLKLRNSTTEARFVCLPPLDPESPPNLVNLPDVRQPELETA